MYALTTITFNSNNITGSNRAMYVYSHGNIFNGLSLLNNSFVSDNIGLYFNLIGVNLTDIIVRGILLMQLILESSLKSLVLVLLM